MFYVLFVYILHDLQKIYSASGYSTFADCILSGWSSNYPMTFKTILYHCTAELEPRETCQFPITKKQDWLQNI